MYTVLIYFIICGSLSVPGAAQRRIVHGSEVHREQYGFQVSVWKRQRKQYFCTGAIISNRVVITCAHCYEGLVGNERDLFIKVGALNLHSASAKKYNIQRIYQHEFYSSITNKHDIGLLLIKGTFTFNNFVKPIELSDEPTPEGATVTISGWGANGNNKNKPMEHLMAVNRTKINLEKCRNSTKIEKYQRITENSFCTQTTDNKGTCNGDSGGPVLYFGKLVGVVTGGVECAQGLPDVHVNITRFKLWILLKCLDVK